MMGFNMYMVDKSGEGELIEGVGGSAHSSSLSSSSFYLDFGGNSA